MSARCAIVELHREELKFSAGHFMLFSAEQRESMHGHDYQVQVSFHTLIEHNGMSFDCRYYKQKILQLCRSLDYHFLLPSKSEYLRLEEQGDKWLAHIGNEIIPFLKRDTIILPITNVTLEELSYWFLSQLTQAGGELVEHKIFAITVKVYNGRGESGASTWNNALNVKEKEFQFELESIS